jgi:hypothetical protein
MVVLIVSLANTSFKDHSTLSSSNVDDEDDDEDDDGRSNPVSPPFLLFLSPRRGWVEQAREAGRVEEERTGREGKRREEARKMPLWR